MNLITGVASASITPATSHLAPELTDECWPWIGDALNERPASLPAHLDALLGDFDEVDLDSIADTLLDRIDTKFVLSIANTGALLSALTEAYSLLTIDGRQSHHYRTLYFDTPSLDLYRRHVTGSARRIKIRNREYVDSGLRFTELKRRTRLGRTKKHRVRTPSLTHLCSSDPAIEATIEALPAVQPVLLNEFERLTLVRADGRERLTLDLGIRFATSTGTAQLLNVAVIEVKQDRIDRRSPAIQAIRQMQHDPGFSKYALGIAALVPGVRHNSLKPALRQVSRLGNEVNND